MLKWIHHLLNPHCKECRDELREAKECSNCETLRGLLEAERRNNSQLLEKIIAPKVIEKIERISSDEKLEPIGNKYVPWRVRQQMLEQEDAQRAKVLKEHNFPDTTGKPTDEIEKELGVSNG
jgi:hypothetical protein